MKTTLRIIRLMRQISRSPSGLIGLVIVSTMVVCAVFAPLITPYPPEMVNPVDAYQPPSTKYWFGTDEVGSDVFSRVVYGARASLVVALGSVFFALIGGVPLGLLSGYYAGQVDTIIMRSMDVLMAFPVLFLAIGITAALGPNLENAIVALSVVYLPHFARITRGQVLSIKEMEFIMAGRMIGATTSRLIIYHILPNIMTPIIVQSAITLAFALLIEGSLSFLGLGVQPPTPSWGSMINTGMSFLEIQPWMSIAPGTAIMLAILGFNFLGDGLRDALDPARAS